MTSEWRKSTYSDTGGQCVECRSNERRVDVRDTQNRGTGYLTFPASEWSAFLRDIQDEQL
ncbi:DUF397 domain-containing protein [Halostreptopolyspora alba]|uniref:DUF397 domain-containing protein n=1 Tax=Halostreptopolyspora alba TaxID=2487137 RepID=A0A3N0EG78_9ACTN|nr:DUF397 domain-containing protein [Nocardiopsaceae bacterium YIM 96095]